MSIDWQLSGLRRHALRKWQGVILSYTFQPIDTFSIHEILKVRLHSPTFYSRPYGFLDYPEAKSYTLGK